jgi:DNA-binding CsgD family transcriptional regulator
MLLEREPELRALGDLVENLDETGGKVVLIRGEAGIGKSSLVSEFARLWSQDAHVLYGACDDLFIPQPLCPFTDWCRDEPSLRAPMDSADRLKLFQATLDVLSRTDRPTILIMEDTHWADEATLDAIRYIGRRIARTNGLLLLTYRVGEVDFNHPLRAVIGDIPATDVARMELDGLSLEAVTSILVESELDATEVMHSTRGNPFLVTEMMSAADEGVPGSLHDSVMARVRKLSIGAQEMLKLFAVIPEAIDTPVALGIVGVDERRLDECEQRGLLECGPEMVQFRHDLIRRAVESSMSTTERLAKNRAALELLPRDTHPCLLVHCAVEVADIDTLIVVAPRSARWAVSVGSRKQAAEDFREIGPYLDRYSPEDLGPLLDEWASLEFLVDDMPQAIRLNDLARDHYRRLGDQSAESRALARAAHCHEIAGQRRRAEALAHEAVEVLGDEPNGADLARALEVNAYLQVMTSNVDAVPRLVDRTIEAGGSDIDDSVLIRSLIHRGTAANITDYPDGQASLDEARERAEAAGQWYEACRALLMHAWAAAEFRDLATASDYARRAVASAVRHDIPSLEASSKAQHARVLELGGHWDEAADLARGLADAAEISQMVSLPVLGVIEARKGRPSAPSILTQAREMASSADEFQRLAPAAIAGAEYAWISRDLIVTPAELHQLLAAGLVLGLPWSSGALARWLWELGELRDPPPDIAEPYRMLISGDSGGAAAIFEDLAMPYERALSLMHGSQPDQLAALEAFETLGASAVAARLRRSLRGRGVSVPRGKGRETRRHVAGLTARQAEVLRLLDEDLSNLEIADRLFISPRTAENHVSAVFDKLDVTTREEAVARAHAEGLLTAAL